MRKVWLLASTVLAFLNFVKSQEVARTLYSARYDNLDIDTILGSNRLVSNYVDCLLSRKPCPPEGKDLKRILPEALRTKCTRCSPIQKENALKIITRLYFDYPDQYRALRERWDQSGEYHRRFEDYLRGLQFNQIGGSGGNGGGAAAVPSAGGGNTVESGGNDRPVRNDLDRQPASQSSNVQAVVIDPALPIGDVNTFFATPPPPPPPAATERPRPPAPVAQILFPTTTVAGESSTSPATTTPTTTTTTTSTTTSTSTSTSGPVELTSGTSVGPAPSNTVTSTSTIITPFDGSGAISSTGAGPSDTAFVSASLFTNEQDAAAASTAGPVEPAPVPLTVVDGVVQSLQPDATSPPHIGTVRPDGIRLASQQAFAQQNSSSTLEPWSVGSSVSAQSATSSSSSSLLGESASIADQGVDRNFTPNFTAPAGVQGPVVGGFLPDQNYATVDGNDGPPQSDAKFDVSTTTGRTTALRTSGGGGVDELTTAPPLVVVNRFGEDAGSARPSFAPAPPPVVTTTTTTQRPTTTVRQTRPVTRQTTTRNTQRPTTRFITRVPQTPPPTPPRTTRTTTSTILLPRPPPPPPQQQPLLPQAPPIAPQAYPTILYERPQAPPRATAPPPPYRPLYVPESPATPPAQYGTTPDSIIDHFFVPPPQAANAPLPPSPIVGLWNQLGSKIADTADAIAGMLQKTVDVLVTSHIQSHQRALRRT